MHHHNYLKKKAKKQNIQRSSHEQQICQLVLSRGGVCFYLVDRDCRKSTLVLEFMCETEIYSPERQSGGTATGWELLLRHLILEKL